MAKRIDIQELERWLSALVADGKLFGPLADTDEWGKVNKIDELGTAFDTTYSPKSLFLPNGQVMFTAKESCPFETLAITETDIPDGAVLWGIHPCDARALELVHRVMNENDCKDPYFNAVWERMIRVAIGCNNPAETCFCTSFIGGSPFGTQGVDVLATYVEQNYIMEAITKRGEMLIANFPDAEQNDIDALAEVKNKATSMINSSVPTEIADEMIELFDNDEYWSEISEHCQKCFSCTSVCPGCYCFDIVDSRKDGGIQRCRVWDSCLSEKFTLSPSGYNPRNTQMERLRQRFMHKLSFFAIRYDGTQLCTGCGRCIKVCQGKIDIRKIALKANLLKEKQEE